MKKGLRSTRVEIQVVLHPLLKNTYNYGRSTRVEIRVVLHLTMNFPTKKEDLHE